MWFRNLLVYRLSNWNFSADTLQAKLAEHALQPCSGMESQRMGWVPPKADGGPLVHAQGAQMLISLGVEKKLLPATVIKQFTQARAAEVEEQQGYKPGRKQMKQLKEAITDELLPRAFAIRRKTYVWIDAQDGWLVVDAGSLAKADEVVEMLIKSLGDFTLNFLNTEISPTAAMTGWLSGDELPSTFTVDQDCELRSAGEENATVRYVRHTPEADEVTRHIQAGKEVTRLAMTWHDRFSFVLHDNLQIKRLAPLDLLKDQAEEDGAEDLFDADFALMSGELRKLLPALADLLGGEKRA